MTSETAWLVTKRFKYITCISLLSSVSEISIYQIPLSFTFSANLLLMRCIMTTCISLPACVRETTLPLPLYSQRGSHVSLPVACRRKITQDAYLTSYLKIGY